MQTRQDMLSFFEPVVNRIISCIDSQLKNEAKVHRAKARIFTRS